jgi:arginine/ornithine N-succinyltransferase beta subunit
MYFVCALYIPKKKREDERAHFERRSRFMCVPKKRQQARVYVHCGLSEGLASVL